MKTMVAGAAAAGTAAVPKTRVATAAEGRGAAPAKSKLPILVGVGAVVVAGVGFALKGTLFPAKPATPNLPAATDTTTHAPAPSSPQQQQQTSGTPAGGTPGAPQDFKRPVSSQTAAPPPSTPATPKLDERAIRKQIFSLQDSAYSDDAGQRAVVEATAEGLFGRQGLSDSLRAGAALAAGLAYEKDQKLSLARQWLTKAVALDPSKQRFLDQLNQATSGQ
jgi:hypothetical protein